MTDAGRGLKLAMRRLVHLDVPLVVLLERLGELLVVDALGLGHTLQGLLDAGHHALQSRTQAQATRVKS